MSEKNWSIERVVIANPEEYPELEWDRPTKDVIVIVRGRMDDGRAFDCLIPITPERLAELGEEKVKQMASDEALPPEESEV